MYGVLDPVGVLALVRQHCCASSLLCSERYRPPLNFCRSRHRNAPSFAKQFHQWLVIREMFIVSAIDIMVGFQKRLQSLYGKSVNNFSAADSDLDANSIRCSIPFSSLCAITGPSPKRKASHATKSGKLSIVLYQYLKRYQYLSFSDHFHAAPFCRRARSGADTVARSGTNIL